jgi:alpha-L-rhamnosidase
VALMLGFASEAHSTMIEKRMLPYLHDEDIDGARPSSFWCAYALEEMARRGYGGEVIDFIRRRWSPMLSTGTTWEGFEWSETSGSSSSHAWSAHPSYHLVNILAGVTQTAAGWKEIRFAPCFVQGLDRAEALVPSPQGEITASWRREGAEITAALALPAGVAAEVELPGLKEKVSGPREAEFAAKAP